MPSNLNFNPLNAIAISLKLTPLVLFKVNLSNAIKIYIDPFNATRNWFDLFGVYKFHNQKIWIRFLKFHYFYKLQYVLFCEPQKLLCYISSVYLIPNMFSN
jgi:hypothetical protein